MTTATTKPDREGFLRRLEADGDSTPTAGHKKSVRIDEARDEDVTMSFLQQAGLGSAAIDASSLKALRELCEQQEEEKVEVPPPLSEIQTNSVLLRRQPSDLTQSRHVSISKEVEDWKTDATTVGSVEDKSQVANKMIMDQLETQTALLMEMQRQLDELKQSVRILHKVDQLERSVKELKEQANNTAPAATPAVVVNRGVAEQPPPAPQPQQPVLPRIVRIVRVYWAMQNRQVNLDGGMLFKVLFMVMVLSSRMGRRKQQHATVWNTYKTHVGAVLVLVGFMMQSGYFKFLHNFFVKQNVPARIWNGEEVPVDEEAPPRRARNAEQPAAEQQQQQQPRGGGRGWRDTFFGGVIPNPEQDGDHENNPHNGALRVVQDVVYLLGSFILSVLPMWRPEGVVPPANPAPGEEQEGEGENAVPDQRDAMQPLEESDDEDDDLYGAYEEE